MSYSWKPHLRSLACLKGSASRDSVPAPVQFMALVDLGQLRSPDASLRRFLAERRSEQLFDGTFAKAALSLSPVLVSLGADAGWASEQIQSLDRYCSHLPVLAVLCTHQPYEAVMTHCRSMMRISANGNEYLWRFADIQMMQAVAGTLTEPQRIQILGPFRSWWVVDHAGRLHDLAGNLPPGEMPLVPQPLVLDDAQTDMMTDAIAGPVLASQLRMLEPGFASALTHAAQIEFAIHCIEQARELTLDEDAELLAWALDQWARRMNAPSSTEEGLAE